MFSRLMPPFSIRTVHKVLAMMVVLIIAGLDPAMAGIDFCTQSSCCAAKAGVPTSFDLPDCCTTTISCYDGPSTEVAVTTDTKVCAAPTAAVIRTTHVAPRVATPRVAVHVTSPPPTMSERLSALSLLLI